MPLLSEAVASSQLTMAAHVPSSAVVLIGGKQLIFGGVESGALANWLFAECQSGYYVLVFNHFSTGFFQKPIQYLNLCVGHKDIRSKGRICLVVL